MNDGNEENDVWTEDLDAYVQAYAEEERSDVDAAAAYGRFNDARADAPVFLANGGARRRTVSLVVVGAALAAGLAAVWISNGRSLQLEADEARATLTQDAADAASETRSVVPAHPVEAKAPRTTSAVAPRQPEVLPEEPALEATQEDEPPSESEEAVPRRQLPRPSSSPVPDDSSSPPQPSDLARELTMLGSLRKAARSRDYVKALKVVRNHRAEFARPTFAAERDLIEIEALCGLGRVHRAADAKEAFGKTHPAHHLRAKAEHMCEKKTGRAQNDDVVRHQGE